MKSVCPGQERLKRLPHGQTEACGWFDEEPVRRKKVMRRVIRAVLVV
jgi:hypothetical protein